MRTLMIALMLISPSAMALKAVWVGDSITESSPNTCVARDPVGILCDWVCPGGETCTSSGEYTNAVASAPDAAGNGLEWTCASTGFTIRNAADSGDQMTLEGATRYGPHVAVGKPVTGSVTAGICDADSDCGAGQVCKDWGGFCSWPYDVLVSLYGHNDQRSGVGYPGQTAADGETANFIWTGAGAASMKAMVKDACELHRMKVVLIGVLPWKGGTGWSAQKETERLALNTLMSDFAASGGDNGKCAGLVFYVDADPYVDTGVALPAEDPRLDGSCDGDGIHPDTDTIEALGLAVYEQVGYIFE